MRRAGQATGRASLDGISGQGSRMLPLDIDIVAKLRPRCQHCVTRNHERRFDDALPVKLRNYLVPQHGRSHVVSSSRRRLVVVYLCGIHPLHFLSIAVIDL